MIATKTLHSFGDKGRDNELILFHQTGLFNFVYFLPLIEEQVLSSHFFFLNHTLPPFLLSFLSPLPWANSWGPCSARSMWGSNTAVSEHLRWRKFKLNWIIITFQKFTCSMVWANFQMSNSPMGLEAHVRQQSSNMSVFRSISVLSDGSTGQCRL